MAEGIPEHRVYSFGVFELDSNTGELWKDGKSQPRLREQALQVFLLLLERSREVVTREELRQRVWAADTFVDFDHGMNTAINQLRNALDDSAANPRFIQTLPRRGYRFIAPLEVRGGAGSKGSPGTESTTRTPQSEVNSGSAITSALSDPAELPHASSGTVRFLFSCIQVMYLSFYIVSLARFSHVEEVLSESGYPERLILALLMITAAAGIPIRLYLLSASIFNYRGIAQKFLKLFMFLFPLDELWALAPFLIVKQIGLGLAIAATAALLYLPFTQRSLLLMGAQPVKSETEKS